MTWVGRIIFFIGFQQFEKGGVFQAHECHSCLFVFIAQTGKNQILRDKPQNTFFKSCFCRRESGRVMRTVSINSRERAVQSTRTTATAEAYEKR